jgi:lipopolysaccharide/colanic/teichoic acid biosynthesis glycosyltransferase
MGGGMRFPTFLRLTNIDRLQKPSPGVARLKAWFGRVIKRVFDIVLSFLALILLAPVFGLIAVAIKRDSPGPVFFRGNRMGRKGNLFKILKFRTMYEIPESYSGPKVTAHDDLRITPIGHWLRNTKLNELPQFWNVLKGDMSLVGPRPEDPSIAKTWPKEVWDEVLSVRPGITSPASVEYRNEENLLSSGSVMEKYMQELCPNKIRMDMLYVRYRSFWLDLDTLLWTALVLLPRLRSYSPPEKFLYYGPITRLARRYLSWFTIDLFITFFSIGFAGVIWRLSGPLDVGWLKSIGLAVCFSLLFSFSGALLGVNRISWSRARPQEIFSLLPSWAVATGVALFTNSIFDFFPTTLLITAACFALTGYILARYRSRVLTGAISMVIRMTGSARLPRERILILGSGPNAELAAWLMEHPQNAHKYKVVGFADNEVLKQGLRMYGANVLGTISDAPALIKKHDIGIIMITDQTITTADFRAILQAQKSYPICLIVLPDLLRSLNRFFQADESFTRTDDDATVERNFVPCRYCLMRKAALKTETEQS